MERDGADWKRVLFSIRDGLTSPFRTDKLIPEIALWFCAAPEMLFPPESRYREGAISIFDIL